MLMLQHSLLETFMALVQKSGAGSNTRITRVVSKSDRDHGTATTANRNLGLMPAVTISRSYLSLCLYPILFTEFEWFTILEEMSRITKLQKGLPTSEFHNTAGVNTIKTKSVLFILVRSWITPVFVTVPAFMHISGCPRFFRNEYNTFIRLCKIRL